MKFVCMVKVLLMALLAAVLFPVQAGEDFPPGPPPPPHKSGFKKKGPHGGFFSKLTKEERAEIDRLAREGKKQELRVYFKKLMYKYRPPEIKKMDELSAKYCASKDEKEKAAIKLEIAKYAKINFQKRQQFTKENIVRTEKQLERAQKELEFLKKRYQDNEKNADAVIADFVEQMCLPPNMRKIPKKGPRHPKPPMD